MPKVTEIPTEYAECKALWQWAQHVAVVKQMLIKVVNEGKRSPMTGSRLKAIGMRAGVPDYILPIKSGKYGALWLEIKRRDNGSVSDAQVDWLKKLQASGHCACVCYGWEHAAQVITDYLAERL